MKIGLYRIGPEPGVAMTPLFGELEWDLQNGTGRAQHFEIKTHVGPRKPNGQYFKTQDEQKLYVVKVLFQALWQQGYQAFSQAVMSGQVQYVENGVPKSEPLWRWTIA